MGVPERQTEEVGQDQVDEGTEQLEQREPKISAPVPKAPVFAPPPSGVRPNSGQNQGQRPSLGRIVLYHHRLYEEGVAPAMITSVSPDGLVDLTVFYKGQVPYCHSLVAEGENEGEWSWPPRV